MRPHHMLLNLKKLAEAIEALKDGDDYARGFFDGVGAATAVLYGQQASIPEAKKPKIDS